MHGVPISPFVLFSLFYFYILFSFIHDAFRVQRLFQLLRRIYSETAMVHTMGPVFQPCTVEVHSSVNDAAITAVCNSAAQMLPIKWAVLLRKLSVSVSV